MTNGDIFIENVSIVFISYECNIKSYNCMRHHRCYNIDYHGTLTTMYICTKHLCILMPVE